MLVLKVEIFHIEYNDMFLLCGVVYVYRDHTVHIVGVPRVSGTSNLARSFVVYLRTFV